MHSKRLAIDNCQKNCQKEIFSSFPSARKPPVGSQKKKEERSDRRADNKIIYKQKNPTKESIHSSTMGKSTTNAKQKVATEKGQHVKVTHRHADAASAKHNKTPARTKPPPSRKTKSPTKISLGRQSKATAKKYLEDDDDDDDEFAFEEEPSEGKHSFGFDLICVLHAVESMAVPPIVLILIVPSFVCHSEQNTSLPKEAAAKNKKSSHQNNNGKESAVSSPLSSDTNNNNNEEDDRAACCLCHCGLDYSGREAFFEEDRRKELEEYEAQDDSDDSDNSDDTPYYQATDPYVPVHLYDPANALVYCDGCNRLYHQKCHFVPLMGVPRGTWHCLVCSTQKQLTNTITSSRKHKMNNSIITKTTAPTKGAIFTKAEVKRMFQAPPPPAKLHHCLTQAQTTNATTSAAHCKDDDENESSSNNNNNQLTVTTYHTSSEMEWEVATRRAKALLWHKTLTQSVPSSIQSQMSNWRQAQTALETLTRTKQNRQHFLEHTTASSRGSQELAQTLVKMAGAKYKMRQMIMNLEHIRANPEFHHQQIRQWCNNNNNNNIAITDARLLPATTTTTKSMESKNNDTATTMTASSTALIAGTKTTTTPTKNFMERIVFPFGQFPARSIPRTAEIDNDNTNTINNDGIDDNFEQGAARTNRGKTTSDDDIPREIITNGANKRKGKTGDSPSNGIKKEHEKAVVTKRSGKESSGKGKPKDDASNSDGSSSSGVSLDDAKCCICLIGDATDENDLLLCDGLGCCRAYHMECLEPRVSLAELEGKDDEDWFCPLCSGLADCMHTIQSYYMGEEWDHRREDRAIVEEAKKQADNKNSPRDKKGVNDKKTAATKAEHVDTDNDDDDDDDDSLKSWEQPDDVFPRSKWEYETALQLKDGKQNSETKALLQLVLGHGDDNQGEGRLLDYMSDGTDDVELDQHFDLDAFHEDRRREYEDGDSDDDSTHSSAATLVDMSSVELKIGKDELNALSEGSDDSSGEDDSDSENGSGSDEGSRARGRRQSRRLRKRGNQEEAAKTMGVDFDSNNIVQGKRRRTNVDYRKLNDSMFGDLDDSEVANLDDKEDFRVQIPRKNASTASSSESDDSESEDDSTSDNDSGENSENENDDSDNNSAGDESDDGRTSPKKKQSKEKTTSKRKKGARTRRHSSSDGEGSDSGNEAENDDSSVESGDGKNTSATTKRKKASTAATKKRSPPTTKKAKSVAKKNGSKSAPIKRAKAGARTPKPANKSSKATAKQTKRKAGKPNKKNTKT